MSMDRMRWLRGAGLAVVLLSLLLAAGCRSDPKDTTPTAQAPAQTPQDPVNTPPGTPAAVAVTLQAPPAPMRTVYVADEAAVRTRAFTYTDGATVTCSRDAGATFAPCASAAAGAGSLIWTPADYAVQHKVRATLGGATQEVSFTPATDMPGLEFVVCSDSVTIGMSPVSFATFNPKLIGGAVVCVDDGVLIDKIPGSSFPIDLATPNNVTIIARQGHTATIQNVVNNGFVVSAVGSIGNRIIGMTLTAPGTGGQRVIDIGTGTRGFVLADSVVTCTTGPTDCIHIDEAGATDPIRIVRSSVSIAPGATVTTNIAINVTPGATQSVVRIVKSYIESGFAPVRFDKNTNGQIIDSKLVSYFNGTDVPEGALGVSDASNILVANSEIHTTRLAALYIRNLASAGPPTIALDGNTFVRMDAPSPNIPEVPAVINNYSATVLDSAVGNFFCNEVNVTDKRFLRIMSGLQFDPGGTFLLTNQTPGDEAWAGAAGLIGVCPPP